MGPIQRLIAGSDQQALSEWAGRLADSRFIAPLLKLAFRAVYWPRMRDVSVPPGGFPTLNDLFTRSLRPGARPVAEAALVAAADGRLGACGCIEQGVLYQAKGKAYTLGALLAGDGETAARLLGGSYVTIYLSPRDYHRFHSPCDGRLRAVAHVPGRLLPVNRRAVGAVDELFARNERRLFLVETDRGPVVVVAVAAFLVAGVVVTAAPVPAPPRRSDASTHAFHKPATLARGQELGFFRYGSTIIVLAAPGFPPLLPLPPRATARVGMALTVA